MADIPPQYMGYISLIGTTGMYVAIVLVLAGITWWLLERKKFNKEIIIKKQTGTHSKVIHCKAKQIKKNDGTLWWYISKIKKEAPIPPREAISLTATGNEFCVGTLTPNGDLIWEVEGMGTNSTGLTPEEKAMLAYQFHSAGEWKKKGMLQWITEFAPLLTLVTIIIVMFVFWGQIFAPAMELAQSNVEIQKLELQQTQIIKDIKDNVVRLNAEAGITYTTNNTQGVPE